MIQETWFEAVRPMLSKWMESKDWELLSQFEHVLAATHGKQTMLQVKATLAAAGYGMVDVEHKLGGKGRSPVLQAMMQFVCGYHGLDYRDAAHVGHGRMILLHGSERQKKIWIPRMNSGSLFGIAATEEQGGSRIQNTKTVARSNGKLHFLNGEKHYVSRLKEATAFIVFFKFEQDETLSAALVKPPCSGFSVELWEPMGLRGWSWGRIVLSNVPIANHDLLGGRGQGMAIFKEHFVYYRPMVAMTALGAAAAVIDQTMEYINLRIRRKDIAVPRDSALEKIAGHHSSLNAAILSALCATVQGVENTAHSSLWSRSGKAWCVEQAYNAVAELSLLMGAIAFKSDHFAAKALCDLRGFLFADGIHDALRRSVGRTLMDLPS